MKTLNPETTKSILFDFLLSDNEMLFVRGGDDEGEPVSLPNTPPVRI